MAAEVLLCERLEPPKINIRKRGQLSKIDISARDQPSGGE